MEIQEIIRVLDEILLQEGTYSVKIKNGDILHPESMFWNSWDNKLTCRLMSSCIDIDYDLIESIESEVKTGLSNYRANFLYGNDKTFKASSDHMATRLAIDWSDTVDMNLKEVTKEVN